MPKIVGCPKCGKRYKLPDTFKAKRVRCKACSVEFATDYDETQLGETSDNISVSAPQKRKAPPQGKPKPSPPQRKPRAPKPPVNDALAKAGLSQIQKQPDLFSDEQIVGPDPLRNHVVQDPGFGGNSAGPKNRQPNPAADHGDLEDIVSNPFMDGASATGSVDARRKQAQKRKKEDEILAAYKTNDTPLNSGAGQSDLMENGLNRTAYFWINFAANAVVTIIDKTTNFLSELQPAGGPNAKPPAEMAAGMGYLILVGIFVGIGVVGFFYASMINLRFQNMKFKNPFWKKLATWLTAAPFALLAFAMLSGILLAATKVLVFLYITAIALIAAALFSLSTLPVGLAAIALPPDFGIHKKLDTASYIWLALTAIPLVLLFGAICIGIFMGISNAF